MDLAMDLNLAHWLKVLLWVADLVLCETGRPCPLRSHVQGAVSGAGEELQGFHAAQRRAAVATLTAELQH